MAVSDTYNTDLAAAIDRKMSDVNRATGATYKHVMIVASSRITSRGLRLSAQASQGVEFFWPNSTGEETLSPRIHISRGLRSEAIYTENDRDLTHQVETDMRAIGWPALAIPNSGVLLKWRGGR